MSKVINTILALKDQLSGPILQATKAVKIASSAMQESKKQVAKYSEAAIKSGEAIKKAKENVNIASQSYQASKEQVKKLKDQLQVLNGVTALNQQEEEANTRAKKIATEQLIKLSTEQKKNSEMVKKAKDEMGKYKEQSEAINKQLIEARKKTQQYAASISEQNKKMKEAKKAVDDFGKKAIESIDKAIGRTIKLSLALGSAVLGIGAKMGFEEAFNMEGYKAQLTTAVKSTEKAGELMVNAVEFANKTPFETGEVVGATAKMEAYGISSKKWLADVADMAGATNKGIDQATEAMADAVTGEWERLKEFGIKKEILIAAAAKKYGDGIVFNKKGQVVDQLKMETILQETMQSKFKGGADSMAKTTKGLWSTITGVTKNSLASIIGMQSNGTIQQGSLYERLQVIMQNVVAVLNKWQSDGTIDKISKNVLIAVDSMIETIKFFYNLISENKQIIIAIGLFVASIYASVKAYQAYKLVCIAANIVTMILNGSFLLLLSPLQLIAIAIGAVVAIGYLLWKNWDYLTQKASELWNWFKNLIAGTSDFALLLALPITPILLLIKHFDKLKEIAMKAFSFIKKVFGIKDKKNIEVGIEEKVNKVVSTREEVTKNKEISKDKKNIESKDNKEYEKIVKLNKKNNGVDIPVFSVPKIKTKQTEKIRDEKEVINKNKDDKQEKNKQSQINITLTGDFYGFKDFQEKVCEALSKAYEQNKSNVVGGKV